MHFIVVGLNHKTAGIKVRESFYFPKGNLPDAYSSLKKHPHVKGCVILSTCNRVEIYVSTDDAEKGFDSVTDFVSKFHHIPVAKLIPYIYKKESQHAVTHLFNVAASLDSMVVGEYQIQGQVRDAYHDAKENNAVNSIINKLFQTAIKIGKRVRSETEIGKGSVSVASLPVDLIKQTFPHKQGFNVLLIGAGEISTLAASNLQQFKSCKITVANRSKNNAVKLAEKFKGVVIDYENRYNAIHDNDIIIVSTSSKDYVIKKSELAELCHHLKEKTKIFIDLSVPRNIDPEIGSFNHCLLYSIDDLKKLIDSNMEKRSMEIKKAEKIILDVTGEYFGWYSKQFIIPAMMQIKNKLDILKERTIASYKSTFNALDKEQQKIMSEMLDSYSDKLIKVIMKNIKNSTSTEDLISITETLNDSFTIDINEN